MPAGVVSQTVLRLLVADLGPESPLPAFTGLQRLPDPSVSPDLPPDMRERIAYGRLANPLPYAVQNGYSRNLRSRDIPALRLTNGRLEALALPGLGGRLWSLRDVVTERELVFTNRRLQFANSRSPRLSRGGGGVESRLHWSLGHNEPAVFAGSVSSNRWEPCYGSGRGAHRDLCALLLLMPAPSLVLAFVRVRNPTGAKPLYWWHNIAFRMNGGALWPPPLAWRTSYDDLSRSSTFLRHEAATMNYPYWLAAATTSSRCLLSVGPVAPTDRRPRAVQTSTAQLRGRKLFCWGHAAGPALA